MVLYVRAVQSEAAKLKPSAVHGISATQVLRWSQSPALYGLGVMHAWHDVC